MVPARQAAFGHDYSQIELSPRAPLRLRFSSSSILVMTPHSLLCDGCGQTASAEHIAHRLQRLELCTRFRPVHIGTLLLGAVAPDDQAFLYSSPEQRHGEAQIILHACGIATAGKPADAILSEFQRAGFFLTYVLECPIEPTSESEIAKSVELHLPASMMRIRRSLRPKRLAVISGSLQHCLALLQGANLGCEFVLDGGKAFDLRQTGKVERLREVLRTRGPQVSVV